MAAKNGSNIVVEWLRSLHLGQYADSFLDNGYDDLEICKQVGDPDLDAIGVFNPSHRNRLLQSVRTLREEGAASVYFTLEESAAIQEECKYAVAKELAAVAAGTSSPGHSTGSSTQELQQVHYDEYEEGKAELVRIPKLQLKLLLKDKLLQDGIRLSSQPYTTQTGERGYLEGLASRYADLYNTHYRDILEHLDELRTAEWAELSPRIALLTPASPSRRSPCNVMAGGSSSYSSHHHLYAPGKYSPSSCLSDREEDEIYGLTTAERRFAPVAAAAARPPPVHLTTAAFRQRATVQQPCLSPRSAYFYEFPPADRPGKKKITLTRLLRNFKTHRRDKSRSQQNVSARANTPDCLGMTMMDNRNRCVPMSGRNHVGNPSGFEETIHRLKVQEAMVKKERFDREHEDILREIRHGLLRYGSGGGSGSGPNKPSPRCNDSDETYMYDDDMLRHWYDEPPYESDPEELLMEHANNRVYYGYAKQRTSRDNNTGSIISLRSAGDISLSGGGGGGHQYRQAATGLLLPASGSGQPTTIIPLKRQNRESGDYATSDVQSVCSRMSSLSVETNRSEYDQELYHRLRMNGTDSMVSPGHSSDYADQEDSFLQSPRQNKRHHHHHRSKTSKQQKQQSQRPRRHHSSAESLPSTSSVQALMGAGASQSSEESPTSCDGSQKVQVLALARAVANSSPNPYDKDALKFNIGDVILVTTMNASGIWKGMVKGCDRIGTFKFGKVQPLINESNGLEKSKQPNNNNNRTKHRPKSLLQLLRTIGMEEQISVFAMNGFGDLQSFCEIREADLDYMGIMAPEQRAKILAAVQVMHDYQSPEDDSSSTDENKTDPSCDDSQEGGGGGQQRAAADLANRPSSAGKPRSAADADDDGPLSSSPEYGRNASQRSAAAADERQKKSADERQKKRFVAGGDGGGAAGASAAKPNSCTSSEKSTDSGVSSSGSSVCFGGNAAARAAKRAAAAHPSLNHNHNNGSGSSNSNNFAGHLVVVQNAKD